MFLMNWQQFPLDKSAIETQYFSPYLGKSFTGFKEALAFKESRGNYFTVNTLGYLRKISIWCRDLKGY